MFFNYTSEISTKSGDVKEGESSPKEQEPALADALESIDPISQKSKAVVCPRCKSFIDI